MKINRATYHQEFRSVLQVSHERMPKKVWGQSSDGKFEIVSLELENLLECLQIIHEDFVPNELLCQACDVSTDDVAREIMVQLSRDAAEDGISVVALEKSTGIIAGVCFNSIIHKPDPGQESELKKFLSQCDNEPAFAYVENIIEVEDKINLFEHFNMECYVEMLFLTTKPNYSGRGLGQALGQATIEISKAFANDQFTPRPVCVTQVKNISSECNRALPKMIITQFTSFVSQRIGERLGFKTIIEFPYDMFFYKGVPYSKLVDPKLSKSLMLKGYSLLKE